MADDLGADLDQRRAFYGRIAGRSLAPLWETLHRVVPAAPLTEALPHRWDYDNEVRPLLMEAGGLITAHEAERRVLMLENPGLPGNASVTQSIYAGLQLILPGEVAPAHRHTQSAVRFIVEGEGAYTAVDGEPIPMHPGDLILTPTWTWHDHGNETDTPTVWMDGLDIPMVRLLDGGFMEPANVDRQRHDRPVGDNRARFGANLFPVDWKTPGRASPVLSYPYAVTREVLDRISRNGEPDPCHGYKMRYIDPSTGGHVMATIGAFTQLIPKGMTTAPYRCTDGAVYAVVEGTGVTVVGDKAMSWKPRDVFVVPSWMRHTHRADSDAVLFSISDRPVQEALHLWRQDRGEFS